MRELSCVPVGSRMECMAATMALWKRTAAHCATRSCAPLLCAIKAKQEVVRDTRLGS